jgi:hypothetical protein
MHSECKYLLRHDGLSGAQAQVQLCLLGSHPADYMVLTIKAGTVWQIRPYTHQGSIQQPVHVNDLRLLIGPLQDGLDGVLVQAVFGCIFPNQQPIRMHGLFSWQAMMPKAFPRGMSSPINSLVLSGSLYLEPQRLVNSFLKELRPDLVLSGVELKHWLVIVFAHARTGNVDGVDDTRGQVLGIKDSLPAPIPYSKRIKVRKAKVFLI